eukprot:CAMPEP_0198237456 /NCGR_PEP_ID=MMETSP1446-20131203/3304_1 /TAXON_ID=1461542 ORGANISM="Unidentified sp, Strain CCMP2111" /NCGR_SAMPLE_ID=MMETSP1446 /ASSEMBLY_ACC=CAM_ASM_001112 /LENGTH=971 /DNA_ID=CAMNT_0043919623 /DNA_START=94 /DNA_END=3009 /DNA_ORIENTATION=+
MLGQAETYCTVLVSYEKNFNTNQIKDALEKGSEKEKREAMKKCVYLMLNGENMSQLFMTIVRYVLPSEDHSIQKLLLLYLEQLRKTDASGKLLPEMILICQNLRNNLQHPNEYLRGVTLRFLCRIKEVEILEPLIPSILSNLEHRHSFVRRNAVSAVSAMYAIAGENLLPDAAEMIERFLGTEQDVSARRNALMMLCKTAPDLAVQYLLSQLDQLPSWVDILQLVVINLVREVCRQSIGDQKGKYIKLVLALMQSQHASVAYECATTLMQLSHTPSAVRAAANCYCGLLVTHSDNNVKLIVLDRLEHLKAQHPEILGDMVMDILRALQSPNIDVKSKTLGIVLDLLSPRNIEEVVLALKKEVMKISDTMEGAAEHRRMLVQAIHRCAMDFPDVAGAAVPLLMSFLVDGESTSGLDVIHFVREILETNRKLQPVVLGRLLDIFGQIRSSRVCSCGLWILGEYSNTAEEVGRALDVIKESVGRLPFYAVAEDGVAQLDLAEDLAAAASHGLAAGAKATSRVLSDGTYATQVTSFDAPGPASHAAGAKAGFQSSPNIRALLLSCDYFLGTVVASTYTKLVLKLMRLGDPEANRACAEAMLYIVSLLRLSSSRAPPGLVAHPLDADSCKMLNMCLGVLSDPESRETVAGTLLSACGEAFSELVREKSAADSSEALAGDKKKDGVAAVQADDLIDFSHLKNTSGMSQIEIEDSAQSDLQRAAGGAAEDGRGSGLSANLLNKVVQLTGFSDPVYAEAFLTVHQYDIGLDVSVTNRSSETLQNLSLELATMGDLKLVERPASVTLAPGAESTLRANIKVSSTETGVIFGNILYDSASASLDRTVVVLNDIHIDIMDYIAPAQCSDNAFRSMWAEFEWENKVVVNTTIPDTASFLRHIVETTNMKCLTPVSALEGDCGYLAANLYTRSVFGEDALVNISIEKQQKEGKLCGYVRIRSKTQGIALSLGDKITLKQKSLEA